MAPTLLFYSPVDAPASWRPALKAEMPGLDVRIWPDVPDLAAIDYALIWGEIGDRLHELANLRVVFSLGAGIEHLLDGVVPPGVALVRMIDPALTEGMVEYVVYQVLRHHRGMDRYEHQQREREWRVHEQVPPGRRRIGVLGLGVLGGACAGALVGLGFDVAGWARSAHAIDGVTVYHGPQGLEPLLERSDILVCLLPMTSATRGILGADNLARLPQGAVLINAARGEHVDEAALLDALAAGRIRHAVLDAFRVEPLPGDHPFWSHPSVTVTPHIASLTYPPTGARHVAEGIRRDRAGQQPNGLVDTTRGY